MAQGLSACPSRSLVAVTIWIFQYSAQLNSLESKKMGLRITQSFIYIYETEGKKKKVQSSLWLYKHHAVMAFGEAEL
jgi:hypothetical protein